MPSKNFFLRNTKIALLYIVRRSYYEKKVQASNYEEKEGIQIP